jgi:cyclic-di-GMP-binding protein
MASSESSFDIVCKTDLEELRNAVQHTEKELATRFDFKGGKSSVELEKDTVTLISDDEFKLEQLRDIFEMKLIKRGIDPRMVKYSTPEAAAKMTMRQKAEFQSGLAPEQSKKIVKLIKDQKLKVQASIQGEQVRVTAKSKDDLQSCMQAIRTADFDFACEFTNYR